MEPAPLPDEPLPAASTRLLLYPPPGAIGHSPRIQERFEVQLRDFFDDRNQTPAPVNLLPEQPARVTLDAARWRQLRTINRTVNSRIAYAYDTAVYPNRVMLSESKDQRDLYTYDYDTWRNPLAAGSAQKPLPDGRIPGDCEDFALAKRDALLAQGWPPESLAIAVVGTKVGVHAVLVVRTDRGDLVLNDDCGQDKIQQWFDCDMNFFFLQRGANSAELADISPYTLPFWPYRMASVSEAALPADTRARLSRVEIHARQPFNVRMIEHAGGLSDIFFTSVVDGQPETMRLQPAPHGAMILQWLRRNAVQALYVPPQAIDARADGTVIDPGKLRPQDLALLEQAIRTAREIGVEWRSDDDGRINLPSYQQLRSLTPAASPRP